MLYRYIHHVNVLYKSVVDFVLNFGLLTWYGCSSSAARGKVKRIVTSVRRLGCSALSLEELYYDLTLIVLCGVNLTLEDHFHVLHKNHQHHISEIL